MQSQSSKRRVVLRTLILILLGIGMTLPVRSARAATCTVTSPADSGSGTLRAMINDSSCTMINFNGNTAISLDSTLTINQNVQIDGSGQTVSISGQNLYRVFYVDTGVTGSLNDLRITDGDSQDQNGGGLVNEGTLTVTDSIFDSNAAYQFGGGIFNDGSLTITDSTFYENTTSGWGGAIWNQGTLSVVNSTFDSNQTPNGDGAGINNRGSMTVTASTFTNNYSGYYGAAIYGKGSNGTIANSTFTDNTAGMVGGAIYNYDFSTLTLLNDTFSANSSWYGRGADIFNLISTLNYANNILSDPLSGQDCYNAGTIGTDTDNLVEDGSCSPTLSGNPMLGALADNGGPTQTMALLAGSKAIDAGDATVCSSTAVGNKDQRGVTRPQGAGCDLGAYEYGPVIPEVISSKPAAGAAVANLTTLSVIFNQDMLNDGSAKAANNPANYLLVAQGANGKFDTLSCKGGTQGDDLHTSFSHVSFDGNTQTASLGLAGPLPAGSYRLFICGTTSIWSAAGLELNNGANDTQVDFTVNPSVMPATGFAPGRVTALGSRTVNYSALGDLWLEIPSLGVKAPIVGVPQSTDGSWDISWLGDNAGWLNGTAFPTRAGNSVLAAHVYNAYGLPGPFVSIDTLGWDDPVIVHAGSLQYIYKVREVMQVSPTDTAAMLKHEDLPWITLVSCRGFDQDGGDYQYRILVRAVLTDVK